MDAGKVAKVVLAVLVATALPAAAGTEQDTEAPSATLTPLSDVFELVATSLESLGATDAMVAAARGAEEGDRAYPYIVPAGDLDGDGLRDVVTVTRIPDEVGFGSDVVLTARRGSDGAVLWTHTAGPGGLSAIVPGPVGPDGGEGLLLVRYYLYAIVGGAGLTSGETPFQGILGAQYQVFIDAISASGGELWSYASPLSHFVYTPTPAAVAENVILVAGTLDATATPATDVLIALYDRSPSPEGQDDALRTIVLDGADGAEASTAVSDVSAARTVVAPAPDLDGDGLDDYTILVHALTDQAVSGVGALRGSDGEQLWFSERSVNWTQQRLLPVGDVTGDQIEDLALRHTGLPSPYDAGVGGRQVTLLDGATGTQVWQVRGDTARRLGDVSGDGRSEVLVVTIFRTSTQVGLLYEARRAQGLAWESLELITREGTTQASVSFQEAGDVDADGTPDFAHHLRLLDSQARLVREDARLLSGATGNLLREGPLGGSPLRASVGGNGDDLFLAEPWGTARDVVAVDGLTGSPLWSTRLHARGQTSWSGISVQAVDVTGDGLADLVVNASSVTADGEQVPFIASGGETFVDAWVLSGRDGAVVWHSDPLVVPEPAEVGGSAAPGDPFTWEGAAASGTAATWFLSSECAPDNARYRCDWLLLELANPPDPGEGSRTATATVEIRDFAPVPAPATDFDLDVFESDEFGTRGPLIDSSASLAAIERVTFPVTTTPERPSRFVLVKVEYYTSVESGYRGTAGIG